MKFYENPSSGNQVVSYGQMDRRTVMTKLKLIDVFRNFGNAPKNANKQCH